jgi:hypothetical protein
MNLYWWYLHGADAPIALLAVYSEHIAAPAGAMQQIGAVRQPGDGSVDCENGWIATIPGRQVDHNCKGVRRLQDRRHGHRLHPSRERATQMYLQWLAGRI